MLKKFVLEIIVFITGAVIMILELTGTRILAPYAGTSIIVWTALIGVILGFLSLGYSWGGKLADKGASFKTLADILLISAVLVVLINILRPFALAIGESMFFDVRVGSVFLAVFLFGPASLSLGMVPTYAVRLKIKNLKTSGETVGRLYALSTIGSIVGTFLGGFLLIAVLGNKNIIYALSGILVIASFLSYSRNLKKNSFFLIFLILAVFSYGLDDLGWYEGKKIVLDTDSNYSRVIVVETKEFSTGKPIRALYTGRLFYISGGYQSAVYLEDEVGLPASYLNFFHLGESFGADIKYALFIGGGAFVFPGEFLKRNPDARMDVVELDPFFTQVAREHFGLIDDPRMRIINQDGRAYLNKNKKVYDVVYMDAYSDFSFPWHLITLEASGKIYDSLQADGVFVVNILSALEGESARTFGSIHRTLKQLFPEVYVFAVNSPDEPYIVQNLVLLAVKEENNIPLDEKTAEHSVYAGHLWRGSVDGDLPVLTDDFAPLDYYYLFMSEKFLRKPVP